MLFFSFEEKDFIFFLALVVSPLGRSGLAPGAMDLPSDAKTAPVGCFTDSVQGGSQGHTASAFMMAYIVL